MLCLSLEKGNSIRIFAHWRDTICSNLLSNNKKTNPQKKMMEFCLSNFRLITTFCQSNPEDCVADGREYFFCLSSGPFRFSMQICLRVLDSNEFKYAHFESALSKYLSGKSWREWHAHLRCLFRTLYCWFSVFCFRFLSMCAVCFLPALLLRLRRLLFDILKGEFLCVTLNA